MTTIRPCSTTSIHANPEAIKDRSGAYLTPAYLRQLPDDVKRITMMR